MSGVGPRVKADWWREREAALSQRCRELIGLSHGRGGGLELHAISAMMDEAMKTREQFLASDEPPCPVAQKLEALHR